MKNADENNNVKIAVKKKEKSAIYVIGAGVAGLSCAQYLQNNGLNVIVLEARDRIGGRIHSIEQNGEVLDLGASWIHGITNNPIWDISIQHQIKTHVFNYDSAQYFAIDGTEFSDDQKNEFEFYIQWMSQNWTHQLEVVQKPLAGLNPHSALDVFNAIINSTEFVQHLSALKFFEASQLKNMLYQYYERLANDPFTTSLKKLSADFKYFEGYFEGDEVIFPQGYSQVVDVLAKDLQIQLNTIVSDIIVDHDVCRISTNHQLIDASKVVVSVPLGVLKKQAIQFTPDLSKSLQTSITQMGFGSFNKVFVEFESDPAGLTVSFKENSIFFFLENSLINVLDLSKIYQKPIYLLIFGGEQSEWMDQASDEAIAVKVETLLLKIFHIQNLKIKSLNFTRWGQEQFSCGSFSFPAVGHDARLVESFAHVQHEHLYFAGEHCSLNYAGTVHGAYLSGIHTAEKILKSIKLNQAR